MSSRLEYLLLVPLLHAVGDVPVQQVLLVLNERSLKIEMKNLLLDCGCRRINYAFLHLSESVSLLKSII